MTRTARLLKVASIAVAMTLAQQAFAWSEREMMQKHDPHHGTCVVGSKHNGGAVRVLICRGDFCYIECRGVQVREVVQPRKKRVFEREDRDREPRRPDRPKDKPKDKPKDNPKDKPKDKPKEAEWQPKDGNWGSLDEKNWEKVN